ncbi:MAG: hypothetical protein Ct9H300mP30_2870 [Methanobacteriota archaeon]|nr:MAG: hypothetical protein Ct9H300mP30_2870 [Euryarchaeota archaeon]
MGLGDVIFPGMLVISSVSFLPEWGPEIGTISVPCTRVLSLSA